MRSAVSSILSEMSDVSPLCFPDYDQVISDHGRVLVLVRPLGTAIKTRTFARWFDSISRVHTVGVVKEDGNGDEEEKASWARFVQARYVRTYPVENNEWSEFQLHRGVLGLVSVGVYRTPQEYAELVRLHDALKLKFSRTLLATRLIALSESNTSENGDETESSQEPPPPPEANDTQNSSGNGTRPPLLPSPVKGGVAEGAHEQLIYSQRASPDEPGTARRLEADLQAFLTVVFRFLEKSRASQLSLDLNSRVPLLCAPFERKDFVGLDLESRGNKRRTSGRFKKHLGDLSLLCGLLVDAHTFYETAVEILRSCNDWLWLASGLEGLAAVSSIVLFPDDVVRIGSLRRNSSFQAVSSSVSNGSSNSSSSSRGGGRRPQTLGKKDEKLSRKIASKDVIDYFREIVTHYCKYRHAGVMETEASIKAVQYTIQQGDTTLAAEFLQNIVFINLQMNDAEKVHRFSALSKLYARIGCSRKAAFFHRVAAMRCVAPQNPHPDWPMCYQLLLKTAAGYNIDLAGTSSSSNGTDPSTRSTSSSSSSSARERGAGRHRWGWPALQAQILQEMVGTARRMSDHAAATRHMAFIIQTLFHSMSMDERTEMCQQLGVLTSRPPPQQQHSQLEDDSASFSSSSSSYFPAGGAFAHTVVDAGVILPPVNLYTVPKLSAFQPCPLFESTVVSAAAESRAAGAASDGPFLFTPIQANSLRRPAANIQWVQGEEAVVEIELINQLKCRVEISEMALIHEGAAFEAFPTSITLAEAGPGGVSGPQKARLTGMPKEPGQLKLLGYSCVVFGFKSSCRLSVALEDVADATVEWTINVCPTIPKLEMSFLLDGEGESGGTGNEDAETLRGRPSEAGPVSRVSVFHGERRRCSLYLTNTGSLAVDRLQMSLKTAPLRFQGCISADCDLSDPEKWAVASGETIRVPIIIEGVLPSGRGGRGGNSKSNESVIQEFTLKVVMKYSSSGGDQSESGGGGDYYRQLVQSLTVRICPSLTIAGWDVLPGEQAHDCYVILDIENETEEEVELTYASKKHIVVDAKGTCRIPQPVNKARFDASAAVFEGADEATSTSSRKKFFSSYLEQETRVGWALPSLGRTGHLCLRGVQLNEESLSRLELSSLSWTLSLNGQVWTGLDFHLPAGQPIELSLVILNSYPTAAAASASSSAIDCRISVCCSYVTDDSSSSAAGASATPEQAQLVPYSGAMTHRNCPSGGRIAHQSHIVPYAQGRACLSCFCTVFRTADKSKIDCVSLPKIYIGLT